MTSPEIKSLIKFLQNNGGSVINGRTKFLVTPGILKEINKITQTVKEDIYVPKLTNNDLINKYFNNDELMFLYEFVKKTPKLKISNTLPSHTFTVDIGDFTSLKYLELYKFKVKYVKGLQFLRENLEIIVCLRCLDNVGDLLLNSESDNYVSCIWSKLRHVVLARNNLVALDQSFIHTPWLQYLDISYNNLTDLRQLTCLMNLTHLNVSYNHLKELPMFNACKLKVLVLNNNYITDISGISKLESLQDCDLSDNGLSEHANLLPLCSLSALLSLNLTRNPISYHPMHRSLTCGYLHENVANQQFILDGRPLTSSEREFIRYCSRGNIGVYAENYSKPSVTNSYSMYEGVVQLGEPRKVVKNTVIKSREPDIMDESCENNKFSYTESTCNATRSREQDADFTFKQEIENVIKENGEYWLPKASKTGLFLDMEPLQSSSSLFKLRGGGCFKDTPESSFVSEHIVDSLANESIISIEEKLEKEDENKPNVDELVNENRFSDTDNQSMIQSTTSSENLSDEEVDEMEGIAENDLWLVEKTDNESSGPLFLILNNGELKEVDPVKRKVITRWSMESVERYIKISNDPLILKLTFDVIKRNNCVRKYTMDYADAQKLMNEIDKELNSRKLNQILLRCMKCDLLFCRDKPNRKDIMMEKIIYRCVNCNSSHVLEEDESVLKTELNTISSSKTAESKSKVIQTPPSSLGSATSFDQKSDIVNNDDESGITSQESDIEVISDRSESSVEFLQEELDISNNSYKNERKDMAVKVCVPNMTYFDLPVLSTVTAQMLTESSSSSSMTDSSCTTIETNYRPSRGSHRISQSTSDEVLPEESSAETSPRQLSEEKSFHEEVDVTNGDEEKQKTEGIKSGILSYVNVIEDALKTVGSRILSSTPPKRLEIKNYFVPFEYSFTNFAYIDHRIKFTLLDKIVTYDEEISAFIKVNAIFKFGTSSLPFPGFLVFTNKKMYMVKITKEESDENPEKWMQKFENVNIEKIKLIQPILWKQGFCIEVEDRTSSGDNMKYVMLLHDGERTDSFLSFIRDLGTVHVQETDELLNEKDTSSIFQVGEHIRQFVTSDSISVVQKNGESKSYYFVGLIITDNSFKMLKCDVDWLLPKSCVSPTVILTETMFNLNNVEDRNEKVVIDFEDERKRTGSAWHIKTVSSNANYRIIDPIREPWGKLFMVPLNVDTYK